VETKTIAYGMADMAPSPDGERPPGTVRLPEHRGGCGAQHTVTQDEDGHPLIDCPACAPALIGSHYGWAASPAGVPLTVDELGERELAERDGIAMQRIMVKSLTDDYMDRMRVKETRLPPSTLVSQLAKLSAAERAEIAALLSGKSEDTPEPEPVPAPRKPGRPRTRNV
jgi:hypothetical protein